MEIVKPGIFFLQWASSRLHIPHAASGVGHLGGVLPASLDVSTSVREVEVIDLF